jgi:hypothetical protein
VEKIEQTCRHCGKQFAIDSQVCPFCNTPVGGTHQDVTLSSISVAARLDFQRRAEYPIHFSTALVGNQVALYIEDASVPLVIDLSERVTLGRRSPRDTGVSPTVSLNQFDAFNRGISRIHAVMYYENDTVMLVDEYSTNGTWVNGRQLEPMQPTPLAHGDEIRLARLRMLVLLNKLSSDGNHKPKA